MAAKRSDIESWLKQAQKAGATHVIVVCDTYDWDDYPVEVRPNESVREVAEKYNGKEMQRVMEVYSLTGKYTIESQLSEGRAFHYN